MDVDEDGILLARKKKHSDILEVFPNVSDSELLQDTCVEPPLPWLPAVALGRPAGLRQGRENAFFLGFGLLIAFRASLRGSAGRNAGPGEPFPAEPGGGGGRGLG